MRFVVVNKIYEQNLLTNSIWIYTIITLQVNQ